MAVVEGTVTVTVVYTTLPAALVDTAAIEYPSFGEIPVSTAVEEVEGDRRVEGAEGCRRVEEKEVDGGGMEVVVVVEEGNGDKVACRAI